MPARALCVLALVTGTAAADDFAWEAPASCPDASEVRQRIDRRLADDVDVRGIAVSITRERGGFVAHIDTRAITVANGARTLTSARCDELADAVAVVVARLATEAGQHKRVAVVEAAATIPSSDLELETHERPRPAPLAPAGEASPPLWGGGVRALALSGIGIVPSVGLGGELAGFVRRRDAFAELAVARWDENPTFLVAGAPGRVDVGLRVLAVRGGWSPSRMPLRAWLGVETGELTGTGVALRNPTVGSGTWTAIASGFGVAWPMSPHSRLVGTFEVAVTAQRPTFTLGDGSEIYQSPRGSARCALGLEVGWR